MAKSRVVLGALCVVLFGGCDRGESKAGPSCDAAAAQIVTALTKGKKDVSTMEAKGKIVKTCTDDKWPEPARTCLTKMQSRDDLKKCEHDTLTGAQSDKLDSARTGLGSMSTDAAMKKMSEFADKMCACKDAKCAQDVSDEMTKWGQEMSKEMDEEPPKMSEEDTKKATELGQRMGECMQKAMGADITPPAPEPDEERDPKEGDMTPDGKMISK